MLTIYPAVMKHPLLLLLFLLICALAACRKDQPMSPTNPCADVVKNTAVRSSGRIKEPMMGPLRRRGQEYGPFTTCLDMDGG